MVVAESLLLGCLAANTSGDAWLFFSFACQRVPTGPNVRVGQQY
jgi:hypothetical protein